MGHPLRGPPHGLRSQRGDISAPNPQGLLDALQSHPQPPPYQLKGTCLEMHQFHPESRGLAGRYAGARTVRKQLVWATTSFSTPKISRKPATGCQPAHPAGACFLPFQGCWRQGRVEGQARAGGRGHQPLRGCADALVQLCFSLNTDRTEPINPSQARVHESPSDARLCADRLPAKPRASLGSRAQNGPK